MIHTEINQLTHIDGLIMEDHPYILPFEILKHASDGKLVVKLPKNQRYYNHHFSELLQVVSTVGSYGVALNLNDSSQKAFLAEKLRIRKLNFSLTDERELTAVILPIHYNKRSAKAMVTIYAEKDIMYSYELDYVIFTEQAFNKVFPHLYREMKENEVQLNKMPENLIKLIDESHFKISVAPFKAAHCAGHFKNHPMVPAVFMVERLMKSIQEWLAINHEDTTCLMVDSLELFPNKAMPVDTGFEVEVSVNQLSPRARMFAANVMDRQKQEYGNYLITYVK